MRHIICHIYDTCVIIVNEMEGALMTLEQIYTFLAICRLGSFQKAAEELYLPNPTVSHRITQLEKGLGKSLLIRSKTKILLTEEGKAFLPHAQRVVDDIQQGKQSVKQLQNGEHGMLSVGCSISFADSLMSQLVIGFMEKYPNISVRVYAYSTGEQLRMIKNREFQVSLCRYSANEPALMFRKMFSEPVQLIISPEHSFASRPSVTLEDIFLEQMVVYQLDTHYRKMLDVTLQQLNLHYKYKFETNNLQLIKNIVQRNLGVFLTAPLIVRQELDSGLFRAIPIRQNPLPEDQVFLAYLPGELNSLDYLFVEHITSELGGEQSQLKSQFLG